MDRKKLRKKISKSLFTYETEYGKKCVDDIMHFVDEYETEQLHIGGVTPRFCFVCGTKLEEVGLGWIQCKSEKCGEVFLPFKDVDGNQNLMLQNTPFTPNEG